MSTRTIRVPQYLKQFSCVGSSCEDTCCSGWRITIDQDTYEKYQVSSNEKLKKSLKKIEFKSNKEWFAEIILNSQSLCPLLTEEKLCSVHIDKGEGYLSNLCATYPRVTSLVNGGLESSLTVSCPEAARTVLLNSNGIQFEEINESTSTRHLVSRKINSSKYESTHKERYYFLELRDFSIKIVQNRKYSLTDRLLILGVFMEEILIKLVDNEITDIIGNYEQLIDSGEIINRIHDLPLDLNNQIQILRKIVDIGIFTGLKDKRYLECVMESLDGIKFTGPTLDESSIEDYMNTYETFFKPFIREHEYIFENYLVNYMFKNLFPVAKENDVFEMYSMLVVNYSLLKMKTIGLLAYHKEDFNVSIVVKLFQTFSRNVEHHTFDKNPIIDYLTKNNLTNLSSMSILIKNEQ